MLSILPAGFTESLVTTQTSLSSPTSVEISPTGELWVTEKTGRLLLIRDDGSAHSALTIEVDWRGERGLASATFDPSYDGAGPNPDYAYVYYVVPRLSSEQPPHARLSRFRVDDAGSTTPSLSGESVLRDFPPEDEDNDPTTDGDTMHVGGALHFGPDGKLYVAIGDHKYDTIPQSEHVSQVLTSPFGKILRLNPDGTNPGDNPFYTGSSDDWAGAIYALGLRNPYTFAFDQANGRLYINDVGERGWEEINLGAPGANYGWAGATQPVWEGFATQTPPWENYADPILAYNHTTVRAAITGGVFYPSGGLFGEEFAGKYFFADFVRGWIHVFDPSNPGSLENPDTSIPFVTGVTTGWPVDLDVDAAGNLYFLAHKAPGAIHRISILPPEIQQQPLGVSVLEGSVAGLSVEAFGIGSLQYQWQKQVDGAWVDLAGANVASYRIDSVARADEGQYRVVVTNGAGSTESSAVSLGVIPRRADLLPGLRTEFFVLGRRQTRLPDLGRRKAAEVRIEPWLDGGRAPLRNRLGRLVSASLAVRTTGFLTVETAGDYTFTLLTAGPARVWINETLVAVNETRTGATEKSVTVSLEPGYHSIRIEALSTRGTPLTILSWSGPGIDTQVISPDRLTHAGAFVQRGRLGLVSLEAENAQQAVDAVGALWKPTSAFAGHSGQGAMSIVAESDGAPDISPSSANATLSFQVRFIRPGTYFVWLRGLSTSAGATPISVMLDDDPATSARLVGLGDTYGWTRQNADGSPARIVVKTTGLHSITLAHRSPGLVVDKLLLAPRRTPRPTGLGPSESPLV